MKKLEKLKLNQLSKTELEKREMNGLRGGSTCTCGCYYKDSGGSSTYNNNNANYDIGKNNPQGCACAIVPGLEDPTDSILASHRS